LWKQCIEVNAPLFILEDDALLPKDYEANVMSAISDFQKAGEGLLYLQSQTPYLPAGKTKFYRNVTSVAPNLVRVSDNYDWAGTASYIVTPIAAKCLIDKADASKGLGAVDSHLHHCIVSNAFHTYVPRNWGHGFMLYKHPWWENE
jgi:GR25 family glycosyltransferase involved in LPS biosynthesis